MENSPSFLDMLDKEPMNSHRRRAASVVSLGEFIDGYTLLIAGVAAIVLIPYFHINEGLIGFLTSASFLGSAFGLWIFGYVADRIGRMTVFRINMLLFIVLSIISAFIVNVDELFIIRVLVGVTVGMDIPASTGYLSEIVPSAKRGGWVGSVLNYVWTIGGMSTALLALALIPFFGDSSWRIMFGIAAVPALIVYIARLRIGESPRWLMENGRESEAKSVLKSWGITTSSNFQETEVIPKKIKRGYADLFKGIYRKRTGIVTAVFVANCLSGSIATVSTPFILRYVGLFTYTQTFEFSALVWLADFIGAFSSFYLIDKIGRRSLTYISMIPAATLAVIMALFFSNHIILVGAFFAFGFFNWLGAPSLQWVWSSELFPTSLRGKSQGFCNGWCRIAIVVDAIIVPLGTAFIGFKDVLLLLSLPLFFYAIMVSIFKEFETAGKSLEVISPEPAK